MQGIKELERFMEQLNNETQEQEQISENNLENLINKFNDALTEIGKQLSKASEIKSNSNNSNNEEEIKEEEV